MVRAAGSSVASPLLEDVEYQDEICRRVRHLPVEGHLGHPWAPGDAGGRPWKWLPILYPAFDHALTAGVILVFVVAGEDAIGTYPLIREFFLFHSPRVPFCCLLPRLRYALYNLITSDFSLALQVVGYDLGCLATFLGVLSISAQDMA